jgi:MazG family protein
MSTRRRKTQRVSNSRKKKGRREAASRGVTPAESPGRWLDKLVAVQARLRAPDGCPWDREQTHRTLRTYLIEESYEVLEALESGDDARFREELGDLLLQIVFHSQIAREQGRFAISGVIREIHDKMVRRHPHVFGEKRAKDAAEVLRNWEQLKAEERKKKGPGAPGSEGPASLLDGISRSLPATLEGFQLTRRAARIGFDWESAQGVIDKIGEESEELRRLLAERRQGASDEDLSEVEEEAGDLLFAAVNLARFLQVDPEIALKRANQKFSRRFREMERRAALAGGTLAAVPRAHMEELWNAVKQSESRRARAKPLGALRRP